ncbi:hypothetical protein [uncultured Microbacterium sp.]|uniref:hypothetical protein n=1 Tax=uncultured Microbacterium sp. TaxID=191216 RepID=UPI0026322A96|nr:hypothetical protein [uncultured Microbacterium sp.]
MELTALAVALTILGALALLQIAVACGAPFGELVWGGAHRVLPARLRAASAASVLLYAGFAWVLVDRASAAPSDVARIVVWVLFGYFCVGIVMNLASRSRAERWTMASACVVLASATLVIALQ